MATNTMSDDQVITLLQEVKDLAETIEAIWAMRSGLGAKLARDGFQRIQDKCEELQLNIANANNEDTN